MKRSRTHAWLYAVLASALVVALSPAVRAGEAEAKPPPVYYRLVMEGAMFSADDPALVRELVLDLEQIGDQWGAVYGLSRDYNMATHKGAVKEAKVSDKAIAFKLSTDITPDKWVPGGQGEYTVTLTRPTPTTLEGTFKGKFRGTRVEGPVTGHVYAPKRAEDHVPLGPQEHPRLLFRARDLPALREKMKTPFGRAAIEKLKAHGTPAALGLLYQLTGDEAWSRKAREEAELYLAGKKPGGDPFVPKRPLWGRLEELALCYDLCYDALPEDYKARYRAWIANFAFQVYFAPEALGSTNWHVVSNHVANVYSGVTLSALALFDEPSDPPEPPTPPFLEETLPPADEFVAATGVPVVPLTPGKSPTDWLHTEALRQATPDDPREVFYGLEKVHAEPGTTVRVGDFELTFRKMKQENYSDADFGGLYVEPMIEADAKAKAKKPFTMVLYTVIKVEEPGRYVVFNPVSRANLAQMSLAGKLLAHGQVVRLEKGFYPLMCMVQWRMKWGHIAPGLHPVTEEAVEAWEKKVEQLRLQHQTRLQTYASVLDRWKRSAGGNPAFARMYRLARMTSALHCESAIGRGGFQAEVGHYSMDASSGHAKLWPCYRRVMGYDLSPGGEYPAYIPRKLVGGPQDINGTTQIGGRFFAALFPVIQDAWQPEVLAAWQREMKVTGEKDAAKVLDADPVRAFLSYPFEMEPAKLGTKLPLVWEAPDFGYYAFRSGWGPDAFIAQVFLKSQVINGWNGKNAGTWRLRGLGRNWATGPTDRVRRREQENVVWMPEAELNEGGRAHLTHFAADGKTLTLTADMDEVYERQGRLLYSKYGHLVRVKPAGGEDEVPEPSGISGLRAFGFDYSGLSGAPCLVALVDKIEGGKDGKRFWLFQPQTSGEDRKRKKGEPSAISEVVRPSEHGFTVAPPGAEATLQATFAHPATVQVDTEPIEYSYVKTWGKQRGSKHTVTVAALTVPGTDHFFFVGTVTEGEHPKAEVKGRGLEAVVTVGKRTVRFDGEKIVFAAR